jgi:hypothetical protein
MWPRLAAAVEADPEAVFRPATAERLGFAAPRHGAELSQAVSRM